MPGPNCEVRISTEAQVRIDTAPCAGRRHVACAPSPETVRCSGSSAAQMARQKPALAILKTADDNAQSQPYPRAESGLFSFLT